MNNTVQLITYVDRLGGGTLNELAELLGTGGLLAGVFGGVHLLPFYLPIDGADAGFDPIDHTQVDPRLGQWRDVAALAAQLEVMADVVVNHISAESPQFLDYLAHGSASAYAGLFLTLGVVFPAGAHERELLAIYRPRPGLPLAATRLANGETKILWTTFTPQQLDIDVEHPQGRAYLEGILQTLAAHGIRQVRLDAVGYAIKRAGTRCFMLPETFNFIAEISARAHALGLEVLVELHAHHQQQIEIARHVDWVYDFALPPLVLHALIFKTAGPLARWLACRPHNAVTVLDTHDGIGIIDVGADPANPDPEHGAGLLLPAELDRLVQAIHANAGGSSLAATGAAANNLDLYQVNCTYLDALAGDETAYLLARVIQFFVPGVPQVYYVGLLAGRNDMALLRRTGAGRDINRHRYDRAEVELALKQPVVERLLQLIRWRNGHPAFAGRFSMQPAADCASLHLRWDHGSDWAAAEIDFSACSALLSWSAAAGQQCWQIGTAAPAAGPAGPAVPPAPAVPSVQAGPAGPPGP